MRRLAREACCCLKDEMAMKTCKVGGIVNTVINVTLLCFFCFFSVSVCVCVFVFVFVFGNVLAADPE